MRVYLYNFILGVEPDSQLSIGGFVAPYRSERWYRGLVYSPISYCTVVSAMHLFHTGPYYSFDAASPDVCRCRNYYASQNEAFLNHEMAE
jgi:hypothetical protein